MPTRSRLSRPLGALALAILAATCLGGCIVAVRDHPHHEAPPPPPVVRADVIIH